MRAYGSPTRITLSRIANAGATAVPSRSIELTSGVTVASLIACSARQLATETRAANAGPEIFADAGTTASAAHFAGSLAGSGASPATANGAAAAAPAP